MSEEYEQTRTSNPPHQKIINILELLDTTPLLKTIFMDMSGFELELQDGQYIMRRNFKPKWSDDFTYQIIRILRMHSNTVTSQTDIETIKIDLYLRQRMRQLNHVVFYTGRSHYITSHLWEKLLKYWRENKENWHARTISESLVTQFREYEDFGDFTLEASQLVLDIQGFAKASLYRSREGLTLNHHQNVETVQQKLIEAKSSVMSRILGRGGSQNNVS